jgi:hypothetical protein
MLLKKVFPDIPFFSSGFGNVTARLQERENAGGRGLKTPANAQTLRSATNVIEGFCGAQDEEL